MVLTEASVRFRQKQECRVSAPIRAFKNWLSGASYCHLLNRAPLLRQDDIQESLPVSCLSRIPKMIYNGYYKPFLICHTKQT